MSPIVETKRIRTEESVAMSPFGIVLVLAAVTAALLAAALGYMLGDGANVLGAVGGATLLVAILALAIVPQGTVRKGGSAQ
jgi:hypothetical protein